MFSLDISFELILRGGLARVLRASDRNGVWDRRNGPIGLYCLHWEQKGQKLKHI